MSGSPNSPQIVHTWDTNCKVEGPQIVISLSHSWEGLTDSLKTMIVTVGVYYRRGYTWNEPKIEARGAGSGRGADTELLLCPGDWTGDLPACVGPHARSIARQGSSVSRDLTGAPLTD